MFESIAGFPTTTLDTATSNTTGTASNDALSMDKEDFLLMFMETLKNQDPMDPMDNSDMMQQLSQLGQMEAVANLKLAVEEMKENSIRNQLSQGAALLDKTVAATDASGNSIVGKPTAYRINDGILEYLISNQVVQIGQIQEVTNGAE